MQKIGIGYEFYKQMIDDKCYYVDKTLLIRDVVKKGGKVTLFTRPRRFGKTLALTTLQTFFEHEIDWEGNTVDNSRYFEKKKIMDAGDEITSMMGQYPVIFLTLKSAKQTDFETSFLNLREALVSELSRHRYILNSDNVEPLKKEAYQSLLSTSAEWYEKKVHLNSNKAKEEALQEETGRYATSLRTLSECLWQYHKKKVIILLDEYDVPLENAWYAGFYDRMVSFIRSLFENSLKTNSALEFAVITGCLRISKESVFTGLNHLEVNTIRSRNFGEYFGFTQDETEAMLCAYDLSEKVEEVRDWYDGYIFGDCEVYNPWSVIKYVNEHHNAPERFPEPYWANTSSNSIIKDLVERADANAKEELERLIAHGTIEKKIHEDITYADVYETEDNLWNFLFFTGYMRKVSERIEGEEIFQTMRIPNREILSIYKNQISSWFDKFVKVSDHSSFIKAITDRDTAAMGDYVSSLLGRAISTFDSQESFYHGFLISLMFGMPNYAPRSNREEGDGRPDIVLYPQRPKDPAYIFEIKIRKKFSEMDDGIKEAFTQIHDKKYEEGILDDGYNGVISFGVCFCRKSAVFARLI